jgi:hypothetical protein
MAGLLIHATVGGAAAAGRPRGNRSAPVASACAHAVVAGVVLDLGHLREMVVDSYTTRHPSEV